MKVLISLLFIILALAIIQPAKAASVDYKRDLKKDDLVYNIALEAYAKVISAEDNDHIKIRYITGKYAGDTGEGWDRPEIALQEGCANDVCVGDTVYHLDQDADSEVVAIALNGQYVIKYLKGRFAGLTGSKWDLSDIGRMKGCDRAQAVCVGDQVLLKTSKDKAEIYGIQSDDNYIVKFQTGRMAGASGHGWGRDSFEVLSTFKQPVNAKIGPSKQPAATVKPADKLSSPTATVPSMNGFKSVEDLPN